MKQVDKICKKTVNHGPHSWRENKEATLIHYCTGKYSFTVTYTFKGALVRTLSFETKERAESFRKITDTWVSCSYEI